MARMTAARAAVEILKREGVTHVFVVPGAAISPFHAAAQGLRRDQPHPRPPCRGASLNSPELGAYGVGHVKAAEGLRCRAIRVTDPAELATAFDQAKKLAAEHRVPVGVEAILERVTSISMSTTNDMGNVVEFEDIATEPGHAPRSVRTLKV